MMPPEMPATRTIPSLLIQPTLQLENSGNKRIVRSPSRPSLALPTLDEHGTLESPEFREDGRRSGSVASMEEQREILAPVLDVFKNIEYMPPRGTIGSFSRDSSPSPRVGTRRQELERNGCVAGSLSSGGSDGDNDDRRLAYESACRHSRVSPNSCFIKQIGNQEIQLKNCELTAPDVKAICQTLLRDHSVSTLDLTSNSIGVKGLVYVIQLLQQNKGIDELNISDNWIGPGRLKHLTKFLTDTKRMKKLNISGNGFNDKDGQSLADIIENNRSLEYLNASRNEFGDETGKLIGAALAENEYLQSLDLSWNHLRGKGADAISNAVAVNTTLESLNVSWNGFGFGGTVCMSNALKQNETLTELDMSNNRIHQKQFLELQDGIMANRSLRVLKVALNPVPAVFTSAFLLGIKQSADCGLRELDMSGIVVDREFEEILEDIQQDRMFICHYERSLAVNREREMEKLKKTAYNVDPVKILFFIKSKTRAVDFFRELDKGGGAHITREALFNKFKIENVAITSSAMDKLFAYFGQKDKIDLATFMDGERRHRRKTLTEERRRRSMIASGEEPPPEYSATFFKQGGQADSKERRLSQAVIDFMQKRRSSVAASPVAENSSWRRVSGALLNNGLLKTGSADQLSSDDPVPLPPRRERSKSVQNDESFLPPIVARNRRMSTVDNLSLNGEGTPPNRSRRSSIAPTLPTIVTSKEAWEDE